MPSSAKPKFAQLERFRRHVWKFRIRRAYENAQSREMSFLSWVGAAPRARHGKPGLAPAKLGQAPSARLTRTALER